MAPVPLRVLLITGDGLFLKPALEWFAGLGHRVAVAASVEEASIRLGRERFDVAVLDDRSPDGTVDDRLRTIGAAGGAVQVLLLAEGGTIDAVVEAFRAGASDYLVAPCLPDELERRCRRAHEALRLRCPGPPPIPCDGRHDLPEMIGASPAVARLRRLIKRVGPSDRAVLIEGESGVGKELVARAVLRESRRAGGPFVTVNCAALPESLLESEFFGHERGAFTGATAAKVGLFEAADGGTLFVDEIGELAPTLQAKLLRVLEDGTFRRVGSVKERRADVRLIAATNRDLAADAAAGRFREDLYYRINVLSLKVPPLREREGDMMRLAEAFLGEGWLLDSEAQTAVERYRWPGNVRQLKNAIERGKVLADGGVIRLCDLPMEVVSASVEVASAPTGDRAGPPRTETDDIATLEREHVLEVLRREAGNKSLAARALGIHRRTLYRMLERWDADCVRVADRSRLAGIAPFEAIDGHASEITARPR